jgi:hypothetical protein
VSEKLPYITTYFVVTSDAYFDPREVAQRLDIEATSMERQGDPRPPPRPPVKQSMWRVECKGRRIQSIDDGIREVLDIVWPHRVQIRKLLTEFKLSATFVSYVRIHDLGVVYEILPETLSQMADLRAEWNMDLYDSSE